MRLSLVIAIAAAALAAPALSGFAWAATPAKYASPVNRYGQPDLTGTWTNATVTPVERPRQFGARRALTEPEAAAQEARQQSFRAEGDAPTDPNLRVEQLPPCAGGQQGASCGYNRGWTDPGSLVMRVRGEPRSSMITTTPDGRVPPRRPDAPPINRAVLALAQGEGGPAGPGRSDNPESRGLPERCIFMPTLAGPVLRPVLYNNNYQIVQSKDSVAIMIEMIHDVRIVRLGAKHRTDGLKPWMGDSIGWYEGKTLVVETTNYHPNQAFYGSDENLKVTERFTRTAPDRLFYQFTVEDPTVWAQPWGGEYEFAASRGIYEYACHEGNYGLTGILAGARAEEGGAPSR